MKKLHFLLPILLLIVSHANAQFHEGVYKQGSQTITLKGGKYTSEEVAAFPMKDGFSIGLLLNGNLDELKYTGSYSKEGQYIKVSLTGCIDPNQLTKPGSLNVATRTGYLTYDIDIQGRRYVAFKHDPSGKFYLTGPDAVNSLIKEAFEKEALESDVFSDEDLRDFIDLYKKTDPKISDEEARKKAIVSRYSSILENYGRSEIEKMKQEGKVRKLCNLIKNDKYQEALLALDSLMNIDRYIVREGDRLYMKSYCYSKLQKYREYMDCTNLSLFKDRVMETFYKVISKVDMEEEYVNILYEHDRQRLYKEISGDFPEYMLAYFYLKEGKIVTASQCCQYNQIEECKPFVNRVFAKLEQTTGNDTEKLLEMMEKEKIWNCDFYSTYGLGSFKFSEFQRGRLDEYYKEYTGRMWQTKYDSRRVPYDILLGFRLGEIELEPLMDNSQWETQRYEYEDKYHELSSSYERMNSGKKLPYSFEEYFHFKKITKYQAGRLFSLYTKDRGDYSNLVLAYICMGLSRINNEHKSDEAASIFNAGCYQVLKYKDTFKSALEDAERFLSLAEKAAATTEKLIFIYDSMGELCLIQNKEKEAKRYWKVMKKLAKKESYDLSKLYDADNNVFSKKCKYKYKW